jgi:hypothetical protein
LWFHGLAAIPAMAAFRRHMSTTAHLMLWLWRYFTAYRQRHRKNREDDDQDKAARKRRDHNVESNT